MKSANAEPRWGDAIVVNERTSTLGGLRRLIIKRASSPLCIVSATSNKAKVVVLYTYPYNVLSRSKHCVLQVSPPTLAGGSRKPLTNF